MPTFHVHKPRLLFQAVSPTGQVSAEFRNHRLYNPWADEDGWLQFTRLELRFYPLGVPKIYDYHRFRCSAIYTDPNTREQYRCTSVFPENGQPLRVLNDNRPDFHINT
ncbi:Oidioi.mRNA.OKI2018_I69.XSR.g15582.t1.cds [Oikopleura dioica]|uniref:Oidioi.mRNA.OKI2018_I69.XSR.g15582.t1.cds n=1 Tax=Oikopleura dioica TaxID=34765 RepID=A0ABN7SMI7_OIKDI|nr:Oidioi.mRNA.OKI2018_I69.XSR.g15582.t1.cds [Oikopleura dioica]